MILRLKHKIFSFGTIFTVSAIILCSCGQKEKSVPKEILSEKKMVEVIVGLNLTDAIITSKTDKNEKFKFNVFKECSVSRTDYEKSLKFYSDEPERLKKIYQAAIDSLNHLSK